MTQQVINVGTIPNDGTGDTLRGSCEKTNANFTELYTHVSDLASTLAGKGAALVGSNDVGSYFTATTVEGILQEIGANYATDAELASNATADRARANHTGTQVSTTISDFNEAAQDAVGTAFAAGTSDGATVTYVDGSDAFNVANTDKGSTAVSTHVGLSDPHTQYTLETDLASTSTGLGASLVGIEDINTHFVTTNVEGALNELAVRSKQTLFLTVGDETTAITTGTTKFTFRAPYAFTISEIRATLTTAQASGSTFTVDVNKNGSSLFSTVITIDNTEKTSKTAATPAVFSSTTLADDDEITIDVDQVGDGTATGLKIQIIGLAA